MEIFQPALPMRGVTRSERHDHYTRCISTRTPHAGSDRGIGIRWSYRKISTRTPHAGSDDAVNVDSEAIKISTRTPHAGSDPAGVPRADVQGDFNPHSPCGE